MKTIYLARHAKSSWTTGSADFGRPLSVRGETDAMKVGRKMFDLDWRPQKIISSPAVRAKLSCQVYCEILKFNEEDIEWNSDIYNACTITLLQLLTNLDENTESVMLLGHNPSMEDLIVHLCGYSQVNEQKQADGKIFTTANVAKITTESLWKDIVMDEMQLHKILRPKEL